MGWVLSNWKFLLVAGAIVLILTLRYCPYGSGRKWLLRGSVGLILVVIASLICSAVGAPGREETVDQEVLVPVLPTPVDGLEPLSESWDSEATADWRVAELLAQICNESYQSPIDAEAAFRDMGFSTLKTFVDSSMVGYVMTSGDSAVVVFRGTDDRFDWFTNLDERGIQTPHGMIHRGFLKSFEPLRDQITKIIKQTEAKHIWITGHSLGGALAVVCAYDLIEQGELSFDGLITFGQPMVARDDLASYLDNQLIGRFAHYVNERDIVPRIPPGHRHFGSLVWFKDGQIKRSKPKRQFSASSPGDSEATNSYVELVPLTEGEFQEKKKEVEIVQHQQEQLKKQNMYGAPSFIEDHDISEYLSKIRDINSEGK